MELSEITGASRPSRANEQATWSDNPAFMSITMAEAREYCLKLERDRERFWRKTRQGRFEFSFFSFDKTAGGFDDPSKLAFLSDGGRAACDMIDAISAHENGHDYQSAVRRRLATLSDSDRAFVEAVLAKKNRADLGLTRQGFNWKLRDIAKKLQKSS